MPKVMVVNAYGQGNNRKFRFARWLVRSGTQIALISEANKMHWWLRRFTKGRIHHGLGSHGAREVAVWVKGTIKGDQPMFSTRLTKYVRNRVGHDRWCTRLYYDQCVYYSVHANAAIQDRASGLWRKVPQAEVWRHQGLPKLKRLIEEDRKAGLSIVIGGDMNARDRGGEGSANPREFFQDLDLYCWGEELMWLAWSKDLEAVNREVWNTAPGADGHPVLVAFVRRRRR